MKCGKKVKLSLVGMDAKNCKNRQLFGAVIFAKYVHLASIDLCCYGYHLSHSESVHIKELLRLIHPSILLHLQEKSEIIYCLKQ